MEEDGWSVVEGGRGDSFGAELVGRTDGASLGVPGRFGALVETINDDILGDEFFDCPCDNSGFRFAILDERRVRQQERRKREGQPRKGRTARKRAAAAGTYVVRILGGGR